MQIADLHCDLLCYLAGNESRSPYDLKVRCSLTQLQKGGVKWQVMPIFTETDKHSIYSGIKQANIFRSFSEQFSEIHFKLAIENGSSFCSEGENLDSGLQRLSNIHLHQGNLFYLGLTWNTENRFGGGASTSIGLKRDGEILLHYLDKKKIALDLSHASDNLAYEAINYLDKHQLDVPVIASHSNARQIANHPRNLPDALICEIIKRKGLIGLNFVKAFIGDQGVASFQKQLEYFLELGAGDVLCFGADFFYENDVSLPYRKSEEDLFYQGFNDASSYPQLLQIWLDLGIEAQIINKIASQNYHQFLFRIA